MFQLAGFGPERFGTMRHNLEKVLAEWQSQVTSFIIGYYYADFSKHNRIII